MDTLVGEFTFDFGVHYITLHYITLHVYTTCAQPGWRVRL